MADADTPARLPAGWGFPALARKAHYFDEGELVCICRRWLYSGVRDPGDTASPDDCVTCRRLLAVREANRAKGVKP